MPAEQKWKIPREREFLFLLLCDSGISKQSPGSVKFSPA